MFSIYDKVTGTANRTVDIFTMKDEKKDKISLRCK